MASRNLALGLVGLANALKGGLQGYQTEMAWKDKVSRRKLADQKESDLAAHQAAMDEHAISMEEIGLDRQDETERHNRAMEGRAQPATFAALDSAIAENDKTKLALGKAGQEVPKELWEEGESMRQKRSAAMGYGYQPRPYPTADKSAGVFANILKSFGGLVGPKPMVTPGGLPGVKFK